MSSFIDYYNNVCMINQALDLLINLSFNEQLPHLPMYWKPVTYKRAGEWALEEGGAMLKVLWELGIHLRYLWPHRLIR